jgi:hypothetical protein
MSLSDRYCEGVVFGIWDRAFVSINHVQKVCSENILIKLCDDKVMCVEDSNVLLSKMNLEKS